jgi:hypothetical protein
MLVPVRRSIVAFCAIAFSFFSAHSKVHAQQPPVASGQVIISELRFRGPGGAQDEFIELYNNTDQVRVVQALDASAGWSVAISNGQITGPVCTIPNGIVIPARGHYLCAGINYSLAPYPSGNPAQVSNKVGQEVPNGASRFADTTPDRTIDIDIPDGVGVALFATQNGLNQTTATRLDAFGFSGSPALFKEGNGYPIVNSSNREHAYYRDLRSFTPRDTNDNAADFRLVGTVPDINGNLLGAPGPENMNSPTLNNNTVSLLDPNVGSAEAPNRERRPTVEPNANLGTLLIRRKYTNNTGQPVSRLRFRVVDITTAGTPNECAGGPCADVRALTSQDGEAGVGGEIVTVRGVKLEEPPGQLLGGGLNSTLSADFITPGTPIPNGESVNLVFKLGVMRSGTFRVVLILEAQAAPNIDTQVGRVKSGK